MMESEGGVSKNWDYYRCRVGNDLASIYLDLGIAVDAPMTALPHSAMLRVTMLSPSEKGVSTDEEFDALIALEDDLFARLHGGDARYVGRITTRGQRIFYFYCAEPDAFARDAAEAMKQHPNYSFDVGKRSDPNWSTYFDFLYPNPNDYQRICNRRLN